MVGRQKQWENIQGQKGFGGESCLTCMGSPSPSSPRSPVLQHCSKMKTPHGRAASTAVPSWGGASSEGHWGYREGVT